MNITDFGDEHGAYLLELFKKDVQEKLMAEALRAVEPKLREYAAQVVKEMQPSVQSHFNVGINKFVHTLVLQGVKNDYGIKGHPG